MANAALDLATRNFCFALEVPQESGSKTALNISSKARKIQRSADATKGGGGGGVVSSPGGRVAGFFSRPLPALNRTTAETIGEETDPPRGPQKGVGWRFLSTLG